MPVFRWVRSIQQNLQAKWTLLELLWTSIIAITEPPYWLLVTLNPLDLCAHKPLCGTSIKLRQQMVGKRSLLWLFLKKKKNTTHCIYFHLSHFWGEDELGSDWNSALWMYEHHSTTHARLVLAVSNSATTDFCRLNHLNELLFLRCGKGGYNFLMHCGGAFYSFCIFCWQTSRRKVTDVHWTSMHLPYEQIQMKCPLHCLFLFVLQ